MFNAEAEGLNDLIQTSVNSLSPSEAQEVADIFYSRAFGDTFLKKSRSTNVSPINNDQNIAEYEYYVEYITNGSYNNLGYTLIDNPGAFGGSSYTYFHMNWGWKGTNDGWFVDNNIEYTTSRKDIYVSIN